MCRRDAGGGGATWAAATVLRASRRSQSTVAIDDGLRRPGCEASARAYSSLSRLAYGKRATGAPDDCRYKDRALPGGAPGRGPAVQPAHARLHPARRPVDGAHDRPHPPRRGAVNTDCTRAKLPPVLHALMNALRRRADNTGASMSCNRLGRLAPANTSRRPGDGHHHAPRRAVAALRDDRAAVPVYPRRVQRRRRARGAGRPAPRRRRARRRRAGAPAAEAFVGGFAFIGARCVALRVDVAPRCAFCQCRRHDGSSRCRRSREERSRKATKFCLHH